MNTTDISQMEKEAKILQSQIEETEAPYQKEIEDKKRIALQRKELEAKQKEIEAKKREQRLEIQKKRLRESIKKNTQIFTQLQCQLGSIIFKFCSEVLLQAKEPQSSINQSILRSAMKDYENIARIEIKNRFTKELSSQNGNLLNQINQIERLLNDNHNGLKVRELWMSFDYYNDKWDKVEPSIKTLIKQYRIDLLNAFQKINQ